MFVTRDAESLAEAMTILVEWQPHLAVVDMELGEKFRVQGGGLAGDRAQREIDALFSRPVWRLEVIRRRAPERQVSGARQPRTLVGSASS